MKDRKIGDRCSWISGARGNSLLKRGMVQRVIQPGESMIGVKGLRQPGAARDHVSYLILADNGKVYWPRVSALEWEPIACIDDSPVSVPTLIERMPDSSMPEDGLAD